MPKVSVIIPCHNHGHYVDEAVDSVLAQTFDDFEIIIVNDGSTDQETNALLTDYQRAKTQVVRTDNQGLAAARNNGIKVSQGEYILPLDADDRIGGTYLEKAVRILDRNPDIGIVYCRARLFGTADSEWVLPEFSLDQMLLDNIIFCSSLFRRSDWEVVGGYDPAMVYGWEDYDFWLSLIERGCLVYKIPEILFHYRVAADSMVRSKKKEQKVETFTVIFHKHRELYSQHIEIWIDKLIESREKYHIAKLYFDTGDGFNEQQTLTQKLDIRNRLITFDLAAFKGIEGIRFHPINDYCVLHLNSVLLTADSGYSVALEKFRANTIDQNRANLVFTDSNPHLVFDLPQLSFQCNRIKELCIAFEFLAVGKEAFFYMLKRKDDEINRLQSQEAESPASPDQFITWNEFARLLAKKIKLAIKTFRYQFNPDYRAIKKSGLFDHEYYLAGNPDLQASFIDPLIHYLEHGHMEGRNPHPSFDTSWYWWAYADVAQRGENPLSHFVRKGWLEGKNPGPMFEINYYLESNPDVAASGLNPLKHYFDAGAWEGKRPNPVFDSAYYLEQNPEVRERGQNPLAHYIEFGAREGRLTHQVTGSFASSPKISIITPVYNVDEKYLRACIESVRNQAYENWELCLVDDASTKSHVRSVLEEYRHLDQRIKVKFLLENQGIAGATNEAAALAGGTYLGFLDNDDELTRDALLEVVGTLNQEDVDIIYSDECFVNSAGEFQEAHHKPDFSPDLLLCHNYITHFLVLRKELFDQAGGLWSDCDGAQDYDLILRASELTDKIAHIPRILYRWRTLETSTSVDPGSKSYADGAGKLALERTLQRRMIDGTVFHGNLPFYYRVKRTLQATPLVSIIIAFYDQPDYLRQCIRGIHERTSYQQYEIIGINNNSRQQETFSLMEELAAADARVRFIEFNKPFNYSAINNYGVVHARGEHIVLMNNDIEVINLDWLDALLEHSQRPEVGAVGAKLYYPDDTIQHAGVIIGIGGFAGHSHRHAPRQACGYFNRLHCIQNVSAVTAALLMVKKDLYEEVGGLDADNFGIALNDVDFCLKLGEKGYVNICTPYCEAVHHESASRGYEDTPEKKERFAGEVRCFKDKWAALLAQGDPCYNPNLSLEREDFVKNRYQTWYRSEASRRNHLKTPVA